MTLTLFSPAKINLFLRVVGRRPDGFHALSSLFQTISLGDTIHFSLADTDSLTCTDPSIPTDSTNLIMKAANLFRQKTGLRFGLKIHLDKKIPSQAGLGGGSSNAATTLWALNQLHDMPASVDELQMWSAEIGSDIPFFFSHGTAYCTGRGEFVKNLPSLYSSRDQDCDFDHAKAPGFADRKSVHISNIDRLAIDKPRELSHGSKSNPDPCWSITSQKVTIVKPDIGLPTPAVFARFRTLGFVNHLTTPQEDLELFLTGRKRYFNDLESAAFAEQPSLTKFKKDLLNYGFDTVLMTGTGSAFFCLGQVDPFLLNPFFKQDSHFINRNCDNWY